MNDSKSKLPVDDEIEQSLYAKRQKIYPRHVTGIFAWLRNSGVLILLGFYYISPWLQWDDRQMLLFDLPARKFYIFNLVFWPQDFFYLTLLLILAALTLFFSQHWPGVYGVVMPVRRQCGPKLFYG